MISTKMLDTPPRILPRIDLHRHFGGCCSPQFVWDQIRYTGAYYLAENYQQCVREMTFAPDEPCTMHRFFGKFRLLDGLPWTEDSIRQSIAQVCGDITDDQIDYTWLRFSVNKYLANTKFHRHDLIKLFHECCEQFAPGRIGLVLSLKYDSPRAGQQQTAKLIANTDVRDRLIGIDLVGDEAYFDKDFYGPLLRDWRDAGKFIMAHVGENPFSSCKNISDALDIGVTEICHGLAAAPRHGTPDTNLQAELLARCRELKICFHTTITSNYLTGVWTRPDSHPAIALLRSGNLVTLGTDDPIVCGTDYDKEFTKLIELGATPAEVARVQEIAAARARIPYKSAKYEVPGQRCPQI